MGVRGLHSFLRSKGVSERAAEVIRPAGGGTREARAANGGGALLGDDDLKQDDDVKGRPEDTVLLVDALGFGLTVLEALTTKFEKDVCAFELGGCYILLHIELLATVDNLLKEGFRLVFYFDGSSRGVMKASTLARRKQQREERWGGLFDGIGHKDGGKQRIPEQKDLPYPPLVVDELRTVLSSFASKGVEVVECQGEADQDLARACIELNASGSKAFVYTGDTDFCIFPNTPTIFFNTIESVSGQNRAVVWRRESLAKELGFPSEDLLVEFAILVGNDATGAFSRRLFDDLEGTEAGVVFDCEAEEDNPDDEARQQQHRPAQLNSVKNQLLRAQAQSPLSQLVRVSSSKSPELQTAISYSRMFYALEDVSSFEDGEEEEDSDEDSEPESMSLTAEQKEDIELYTEASTLEIVTTVGLDVIAYLAQACVFEEEVSMLHIKGLEKMQEAISQADKVNAKWDFPLCSRPDSIMWEDVTCANIFQRVFREFIKNSERHPQVRLSSSLCPSLSYFSIILIYISPTATRHSALLPTHTPTTTGPNVRHLSAWKLPLYNL